MTSIGASITLAQLETDPYPILARLRANEPVTYVPETLEEARASRAPSGAPDWEIEGWVTSYASIAAGELERVSPDVERLTGRAPISLAQFLRDNPDSYRHLTP